MIKHFRKPTRNSTPHDQPILDSALEENFQLTPEQAHYEKMVLHSLIIAIGPYLVLALTLFLFVPHGENALLTSLARALPALPFMVVLAVVYYRSHPWKQVDSDDVITAEERKELEGTGLDDLGKDP